MMAQLTKAFTFTLIGRQRLKGFDVWALNAIPCKDYRPPNMEARFLPAWLASSGLTRKHFSG